MNNSRSPSTAALNQTPMNEVERRFAKEITEKMKNYPISFYFLEPIDPKRDQLPNYLQTIKPGVPMDLSTVTKNLEKNAYTTIDDWKKDMNMIWDNAKRYNNAGSPFYLIADELKQIFKRKTEFIPKTEIDEWTIKVKKANKRIMKTSESRLMINYTPPLKHTKQVSGRKKQKQDNIFD